uniref:MauE/DoxX family redox-associated membrane protein n=1 Tax=Novosphingobium sp. B-7 TaxID=1298855 RepID=UPI0003B55052
MIALGAPDAAPAAIGLMAVALTGRIATVGVGLVFLTAAAGKLRHRVLLPGVIANYRLLPPALVAPVASALPVAELVLGAWLLS